jgi:hypothetical protein
MPDRFEKFKAGGPLTRPCPQCGAAPGQSCRQGTGSAYTRRLINPHRARRIPRGAR